MVKRINHKYICDVEVKRCCQCGTYKVLTDFHKDSSCWDGLTSRCRNCNIKHVRQWYKDNSESINEQRRQWRADNYEIANARNKQRHANNRETNNERSRQWHADNREIANEHRRQWTVNHPGYERKRKYGITQNEVDELYLQQFGLCAICHLPLEYNEIYVEHSHLYNAVRGLVHNKCNFAIAMFEDNVELLQRAIDYLIKDYKTSEDANRLLFTDNKIARKKHLIPLLKSQKYICPICQRELTVFSAVIEHNHSTNLIRAVTCQRCNNGLGLFNDDIGLIGQAIQYLIETEYKILIHGGVIEKDA